MTILDVERSLIRASRETAFQCEEKVAVPSETPIRSTDQLLPDASISMAMDLLSVPIGYSRKEHLSGESFPSKKRTARRRSALRAGRVRKPASCTETGSRVGIIHFTLGGRNGIER